MSPQSSNRKTSFRWTAQAIAEIAILTAVLEAGKLALSFLPNIEIVSLLIILYARHFRWKVIPIILLFITIEMFIWGVQTWVIMYLYSWPLLALVAYLTRNCPSVILTAIISGTFGLLFGALCSIVYLFIGGPSTAFAWWVAGLPWDFVHCAGNVVAVLVLYWPLSRVITRYLGTRPA